MDDLQSALQAIFSDPEQMEQILAMANALGLKPPVPPGPEAGKSGQSSASGSEGPSAGAAVKAAASSAQPDPAPDPAVLRMLGSLGSMQGPEDGVLNALRPVVSDPSRIDRALRAARLSRLAGHLLRGGLEHV